LKTISQIKFWQFATASFNCGQLETVLFTAGRYRTAPLKFSTFKNVWVNYELYSNLDEIEIIWVDFNNRDEI